MSERLIYGIHAVTSHLKVYAQSINCLYCIKGKHNTQKLQSLLNSAKQKNIPTKLMSPAQFAQFLDSYGYANTVVHQGVAAISDAKIKLYQEADLLELLQQIKQTPFILVLDSIQDPHNMGACIRTADAAGVDFIIFPKDKSVGINAVVHKVSCGGTQNVRLIAVTNLVRALKVLQKQGIWLVGLASDAEASLYDLDLTIPVALIMGNEGSGLRFSTRKTCDYLAQLPMHGEVASLNISVAAGISMYELRRQRQSVSQ
jgi:23S rRNA (guanosine2251-2'-O)-methyltransferase